MSLYRGSCKNEFLFSAGANNLNMKLHRMQKENPENQIGGLFTRSAFQVLKKTEDSHGSRRPFIKDENFGETTSDSPISNGRPMYNFVDYSAGCQQAPTFMAQDYWLWEVNKICTMQEPAFCSKSWNDLSADLHKETVNYCASTIDMDASLLFPKNRKDSLAGPASIDSSSEPKVKNNCEKIMKIFNVWKVPKVAFWMVSRKDLARSKGVEDANDEEYDEDSHHDTYEKRKAVFGTKRDDLFYKTIGRDVRKYLQDKFQSTLNGRNLKEWMRNGAFLKDIKQFFNEEIAPELPPSADIEKVFWCVATLVSYQGYLPFWTEMNAKFSLNIHDSLHNFTKVKLINLWRLPEFKVVFRYYAKRIAQDNFSRFSYHRTMKSNVKGYKYAFSDILKQWE